LKRETKIIGLVVLLGAIIVSYPIYRVLEFPYYYGKAEPVVNDLIKIYSDNYTNGVTRDEIKESLTHDDYSYILEYPITYPDDQNYLIQVKVNKKYHIGMTKDRSIIWDLNTYDANQSQ